MNVSFLSPLAGLLALAVLLPIAALYAVRRRTNRVGAVLGLPEPGRAAQATALAALCGVAALLALAATQPIVRNEHTRHVRTDAAAWFVIDTSRSMLARSGPAAATRLDRAKTLATELRAGLASVPVGIASLTDRTLPHLFPSPDPQSFAATLRESIGIERPPPAEFFLTRVSTLAPLENMRLANFFSPAEPHRLLVIFTDGESQPLPYEKIGKLMRQSPRIHTIIVRFWRAGERVYTAGKVESAYRADPTSAVTVQRLAAATGGVSFDENQLDSILGAARAALGSGHEVSLGEAQGQTQLAPYLSLGALLPLSFLLWRRNLS